MTDDPNEPMRADDPAFRWQHGDVEAMAALDGRCDVNHEHARRVNEVQDLLVELSKVAHRALHQLENGETVSCAGTLSELINEIDSQFEGDDE